MKLTKNGYELAVTNYGHIEQQANLAVTKAALLVAVHAILFSVYYNIANDYSLFSGEFLHSHRILFGIAGAAFVVAFVSSILAIIPKSLSRTEHDLLFYAGIKNFKTAEDYIHAYHLQDSSEVGFEKVILDNVYGKACWLRTNFMLIFVSIAFSLLGLFLSLLAFAMILVD